MIITPTSLSSLQTGFSNAFEDGKSQAQSQYEKVATVITSTSKSNTYGWLGKFPKFREWIGERVINDMAAHGYQIENKTYESTIGVDRDDIEDDNIGIYKPLFTEMGLAAAVFPDELVFNLFDAGLETVCYDNKNFFSTDHPVYAAHDGTGAVTDVANYDDNDGNPEIAWFLLDTNHALKPFIYQLRRPMAFTHLDSLQDEAVFTSNQFRYGIDCRANAGFGFWQMAYCSTRPLTAENIWKAYGEMKAFKADGGKPLGIRPNMLVVRGIQERAGLEALKATVNGGESNPLSSRLELLVADFI